MQGTRKHIWPLILAGFSVLFGVTSVSLGQSPQRVHSASTASIRPGTSFSLPSVTGGFYGDTVTTKFYFNSNGDGIWSIRMCVSFDTARIGFVAFDMATDFDWSGVADSVVLYGGNNDGYVAVEAYNVHGAAFDDSIFAFTWTIRCLADGETAPLDWFYYGSYDNDFRLYQVPGTFEPADLDMGGVRVLTSIGDVNEDGVITASDIISLVDFVFKSGFAPRPCPMVGDMDCTGAITSADVIDLVNYTFRGAGKGCEVCRAAELGWPCK